jgi:hypothetical protein
MKPRRKWPSFTLELALPPILLQAREAWRDASVAYIRKQVGKVDAIAGAVAVELQAAVGDYDLVVASSAVSEALRAAGLIAPSATIVSTSVGMNKLIGSGLCRVKVRRTTPPASRISAELRQRNAMLFAARHSSL